MDYIEQLISNLRIVYASLAFLRQVEELKLLVAGRAEQIRQREDALLIAYRQLESSIDELSQQVEEERQRIDRALQQYGDPEKLR
ncbi:hypothetical protein [Ktedonobacter racemifer]|uniref:Uncharacterized protein n=1 Tax=Ktedonobacter racemifer DSM 44963 TaxID=485913 RepID=D6U7W5_KTERA|nr:hypothetical protein [Ktedonobacter racemifer]EFH79976.1 conserved hypothetical protein [Ktedonobacter racemifer DSM 44963]